MDFQTLHYFREIASGKTYFDVAEDFHTSQSSVSKAIKHLEEELDAEVFERKSRGVVLTAAGQHLLNMIQQIDPIVQETLREIAASGMVSEVRLCIVPQTDFMNLEMRIANGSFLREHPSINLHLQGEEYLDQSYELIRRNEVDILVAPLFRATRDYCDYTFACENPMYAVLPRNHPLAGRESVDFMELYPEKIISRSLNIRRAIQECCNSLGMDMPPHFEFLRKPGDRNNRMRLMNEVSVGMGISFYFKNDIRPLSMRSLAFVPVLGVPGFPIVVAKGKNRQLNSAQQLVFDYLVEEISSKPDW